MPWPPSRIAATASSAWSKGWGWGWWRPAPTPGPSYLDQRIIDTPHYNRLKAELGWVAQRNNTWSLHVHMGVRGADRAIAVCDWLRELLPILLAASANSPFLDRRDSGLHTVRTEIFTRTFPRCGVPSPFVDWDTYEDFVRMLERTGTAVESTQLWWSVRPHHTFGTVEVRICDAQTRGEESFALAGLIAACIAQTALEYDEHGYDGAGQPLADREIEENLWRAIRHGMSGELIDFRPRRRAGRGAGGARAVLAWTEPARIAAGNRGRAAGAKRRPARARRARRRGLDRGHLPRGRRRRRNAPTPTDVGARR